MKRRQQYIDSYRDINRYVLAGRDPVSDGRMYCSLQKQMTEAELLQWKADQLVGLNAQEAEKLRSHWASVDVAASNYLCPNALSPAQSVP